MNNVDKEWVRLLPEIRRIKSDRCQYCGRPAEQYHHIVPRHMGGDNRLSNIVPLCYECHLKAHSKRGNAHGKLGRKEIEPSDNFDEVADYYLDGIYCLKTALEFTGMARNTFYKHLHRYAEREGRTVQMKGRRFSQGSL